MNPFSIKYDIIGIDQNYGSIKKSELPTLKQNSSLKLLLEKSKNEKQHIQSRKNRIRTKGQALLKKLFPTQPNIDNFKKISFSDKKMKKIYSKSHLINNSDYVFDDLIDHLGELICRKPKLNHEYDSNYKLKPKSFLSSVITSKNGSKMQSHKLKIWKKKLKTDKRQNKRHLRNRQLKSLDAKSLSQIKKSIKTLKNSPKKIKVDNDEGWQEVELEKHVYEFTFNPPKEMIKLLNICQISEPEVFSYDELITKFLDTFKRFIQLEQNRSYLGQMLLTLIQEFPLIKKLLLDDQNRTKENVTLTEVRKAVFYYPDFENTPIVEQLENLANLSRFLKLSNNQNTRSKIISNKSHLKIVNFKRRASVFSNMKNKMTPRMSSPKLMILSPRFLVQKTKKSLIYIKKNESEQSLDTHLDDWHQYLRLKAKNDKIIDHLKIKQFIKDIYHVQLLIDRFVVQKRKVYLTTLKDEYITTYKKISNEKARLKQENIANVIETFKNNKNLKKVYTSLRMMEGSDAYITKSRVGVYNQIQEFESENGKLGEIGFYVRKAAKSIDSQIYSRLLN